MDLPFWSLILFMAIGLGMRIGAKRFVKHAADRYDFVITSNATIFIGGILIFVRSWQLNGVLITIGAAMLGITIALAAPKLLLKWKSWRSGKRTVSLDK